MCAKVCCTLECVRNFFVSVQKYFFMFMHDHKKNFMLMKKVFNIMHDDEKLFEHVQTFCNIVEKVCQDFWD